MVPEGYDVFGIAPPAEPKSPECCARAHFIIRLVNGDWVMEQHVRLLPRASRLYRLMTDGISSSRPFHRLRWSAPIPPERVVEQLPAPTLLPWWRGLGGAPSSSGSTKAPSVRIKMRG